MMHGIGNTVYTVSDVNRISFGNIIAAESRNGWQWFRVSWINQAPSQITCTNTAFGGGGKTADMPAQPDQPEALTRS